MRVSSYHRSTSRTISAPPTHHRRAFRVEVPNAAPLVQRLSCQAIEQTLDRHEPKLVRSGEERELRHRPRHSDGPYGCERRQQLLNSLRCGGELARGRRIAVQEAFREANRADIETRPEAVGDQFGRAAADVEHERSHVDLPEPAARQLGFLLAGEQPRGKAVRPLDLAEKRFPVVGVAYGAGRNCECSLGAESFELAPEIGECVANARDRKREQAPTGVHPFAEPGHDAAADDLFDSSVFDVGHQKPSGIRAEVDRCDAGHFVGTTRRRRASAAVTSPAAA